METADTFSNSPQHLVATFSTLVILCVTFSAANPVIQIYPNAFIVGETESLKVSCVFNQVDTESFATTYNLSIFHAKDNSTCCFTQLAKVSEDEGVKIEANNGVSLNVTGTIVKQGVSYINLTWSTPKADQVGFYKCIAHGANNLGMPLSLSSTIEVGDTTVQLGATSAVNITIEEINIIRQSLADLTVKLSTFKETIPDILNAAAIKFNDGTNSRDNLKLAQNAMFLPSTPFNNQRYWLTRYPSFFDAGSAQATCMIYGGHLAEMDTDEELEFLRHFVKRYGSSFTGVVLGGRYEDRDGAGQNMHSVSPLLLWYDKKPYNKNENCLCLWKWNNFNLGHCPCHYKSKHLAYVCEILVNNLD